MPPSLKTTILVDNQAAQGLSAEHGLSFWVETAGLRILFDTGQGPALADNAERLGIPLEQTDYLVLSHGHYDHTGGIPHLLGRAHRAEVFCHPSAVQPRYSIRDGLVKRVNMPVEAMAALDDLPARRLRWTTRPRRLGDGIGLTGRVPRETGFENTGGPFFLDVQAKRPDPLEDDMALWANTGRGLVVVTGCGHAGLVNILLHALRLSGAKRLHAVAGGFHWAEADDRRLDRSTAFLRSLDPEIVAPCHCTGERGIAALRAALGERVVPGRAGMTLTL